jgi:transcriptional regulator with XRE-family HTH domain
MNDLRKRFGRLLAAHRRRRGLTQEALAEAAEVSIDTISKIEIGATGARFPIIQRLADVLDIDPAELFTTEIPAGAIRRGTFMDISLRLAQLTEPELLWIKKVIDAALEPAGQDTSQGDATRSRTAESVTQTGVARVRKRRVRA